MSAMDTSSLCTVLVGWCWLLVLDFDLENSLPRKLGSSGFVGWIQDRSGIFSDKDMFLGCSRESACFPDLSVPCDSSLFDVSGEFCEIIIFVLGIIVESSVEISAVFPVRLERRRGVVPTIHAALSRSFATGDSQVPAAVALGTLLLGVVVCRSSWDILKAVRQNTRNNQP